METLYDIKNEYLSALNAIVIDEESGEVIGYEQMEELKAKFEDKAEAVALYIMELEANVETIERIIDKYEDRVKSTKKRIDSLKGYLSEMMDAAEYSKLETPQCRVSFRTSKSVNILDENLIPEYFIKMEMKPERKILKKEIGDALKAGTAVEGAELVVKKNIQIK